MFARMRLTTASLEDLARFAVLVNIFLVILTAYSLARFSWIWLQPTVTLAPFQAGAPAAPGAPISAGDDKRAQATTIAGWHLFGQQEIAKPTAPVAPKPQVAPETKLNLKLVGVFYSENRQYALAIIADSGGSECSIRIGERIRDRNCNPVPNGPILDQVQPDQVIISRNGALEKLSLPKETLASAAGKPGPRAAPLITPVTAPVPEGVDAPPLPPPPSSPLSAPFSGPAAPIDASAVVERLRSQTGAQGGLPQLVNATPAVQNGQFIGFRLRPGRDSELFRQMGLQTGDVITEVNGALLSDPVQGMAALQGLLSADQADVRVLRNGEEIPLRFLLRAQ